MALMYGGIQVGRTKGFDIWVLGQKYYGLIGYKEKALEVSIK